MTVPSSTAVTVHITNSSVTQYTFNFKIFNAGHLTVSLVDNDVTTIMTLNTHYTVTGVGSETGGYVVMTAAGIALAGTGKRLAINRTMPFIQDTRLETHSEMPARVLERSLDIATMERQQLKATLDRAVLSDVATTTPIPISEFVQLRDDAKEAATNAQNAASQAQTAIGDISALRTEVVAGIAKVEQLGTDISAAVDSYKTEMAGLKTELTADINTQLTGALGQIETIRTEIQGQVNDYVTQMGKLETDLRAEIASSNASAIAAVEKIRTEFEATTANYLKEIISLRDQIQAIVAGIEETGLVVIAATQAEVNAGTIDNRYVAPNTLAAWPVPQALADVAFTNATIWSAQQMDAHRGEMQTILAQKADLASPALTGTPTAPTAAAGTGSTQIATTAFATTGLSTHNNLATAHSTAMALKANLASPALTGTPTAPTAAAGTGSTQIATTAYADAAVAASGGGGISQRVILTTSGTWTAPNAGYCIIEVIGGGGGGGGKDISSYFQGGGGGAGGRNIGFFALTKGQTISYIVGGGGAGATRAGKGGGATSATINGIVLAGGGGGGGGFGYSSIYGGGGGGGGAHNLAGSDGDQSYATGTYGLGGDGGGGGKGGLGGDASVVQNGGLGVFSTGGKSGGLNSGLGGLSSPPYATYGQGGNAWAATTAGAGTAGTAGAVIIHY